jgi:hypothetical protein
MPYSRAVSRVHAHQDRGEPPCPGCITPGQAGRSRDRSSDLHTMPERRRRDGAGRPAMSPPVRKLEPPTGSVEVMSRWTRGSGEAGISHVRVCRLPSPEGDALTLLLHLLDAHRHGDGGHGAIRARRLRKEGGAPLAARLPGGGGRRPREDSKGLP